VRTEKDPTVLASLLEGQRVDANPDAAIVT